jgi:hypothetical protein
MEEWKNWEFLTSLETSSEISVSSECFMRYWKPRLTVSVAHMAPQGQRPRGRLRRRDRLDVAT